MDDYKSVLSQHQIATVTSYGVRKSRTSVSVRPNPDKENELETKMTDSVVGDTIWDHTTCMHNYGRVLMLLTINTCRYSR